MEWDGLSRGAWGTLFVGENGSSSRRSVCRRSSRGVAMMCNTAGRRLWFSCGVAFAVLLLAAAGCDDETVTIDGGIGPHTTPSDAADDDDVGGRIEMCETMCAHVIGDCADSSNWVIADSADGVDRCMPLCLGLADVERNCMMSAPCGHLDLCLDGVGGPPGVP